MARPSDENKSRLISLIEERSGYAMLAEGWSVTEKCGGVSTALLLARYVGDFVCLKRRRCWFRGTHS